MIFLIVNNEIINFDKIIYIYRTSDVIIDITRQYNIYKIMAKVQDCKDDIELFQTEDVDLLNEKMQYIIFNLKDSQKIYLDWLFRLIVRRVCMGTFFMELVILVYFIIITIEIRDNKNCFSEFHSDIEKINYKLQELENKINQM